MALLDDSEYPRWHDTAAGHLAAARYNAEGGHHHVAVLLAEQAGQSALKTLLDGVGESVQARTHDLLALAGACVEFTGLPLDDELREAVADLARDYLPTRYPDALPAGTPQAHYGPRNAARALDTATRVLELAETTWAALRRRHGGLTVTPTPAQVIARRREQQQGVLRHARDFIAALDSGLDVRTAAVFGSVARGDFHDGSDVDVLIVAASVPTVFADRLKAIGAPQAGLDPVVWTPAEWVSQRAKGNPIAVEAVESGVWLIGGPETCAV